MSAAAQIARWVEQRPLVLGRLDETYSEGLLNSRYGLEHFTIAKPHDEIRDYKLPTICIIEIHTADGPKTYLATVLRKVPVTLFESRLTIKKLRAIEPPSLKGIERGVSDTRMRRLLKERMPAEGEMVRLSSKLSGQLIRLLAREPNNRPALDVALATLPRLRRKPHSEWAQEDAIQTALSVFGIRANEPAKAVAWSADRATGISLLGARVYEDNVIRADASEIPGFDVVAPDTTGRAVFEKPGERLVVYTANRLPLEEMLGVDLIYVNETCGNIVMVQYKMLEAHESASGRKDWIFRPDGQLCKEIGRMRLPPVEGERSDYRLSASPFFFKFVRRKGADDSPRAFLISLDHLRRLLAAPEGKGRRGGIRVSFEALDGTYLRQSDMIGLIRSGYVGTHRAEGEALAAIIAEVAKGNRALVLAWHTRMEAELDDE